MDALYYTLDDPLKIHVFFRAYRPHPPGGWWFRGHADKSWDLIPKAGRSDYFLPQTKATRDIPRDLGRFNAWRKRAIAYVDRLPEND